MAEENVFSFVPKEGESDVEDRIAAINLEAGEGIDIPNSVLNRIIAVKEEHERFLEVDNAYKAERAEIEKKYFALKNEVWKKRAEIISGGAEVDKKVPCEEGDDVKEIPSFWAAALSNHQTIGQLVTEEDMEALEALADISCEYNDTWSGFTLTFTFKENKYFSNKELKKKYVVAPDLLEEKAPELNAVEGTEVQWLPSMNLCVAETKKKQKAKSGRNAGQVRFVTKTTPKPSFFHYFSDPRMPEDEDDEEEEDDENFVLNIDEDYEVAHAFRTELIPDALLWYTGEAMEEHDEDDEDDDEDGDSEDGPAEESEEVGGSAEAGFTAAPGGAQDPNAPECKQS